MKLWWRQSESNRRPIDKLSILVTIAFSYFVFKEKLSRKALIGLLLIVAGTLLMLVKV